MKKSNKKGGIRKGAGRKPGTTPKIPITLYVDKPTISRFGGKDSYRFALYEFSKGSVELIDLGFIPDTAVDADKIPLTPSTVKNGNHNPKPLSKSAKAQKRTPTNKTNDTSDVEYIGPFGSRDAPCVDLAKNSAFNCDGVLKEIEDVEREKIPKERDTPLGRKAWLAEQKKRIQELENKLK